MSLISKIGMIKRIRRGKDARARLVASHLAEGIAFQISATRDSRGLSQSDLAEAAGMSQNNLSRLESPDYGKHTVTSLRRIADALDVALIVKFVPFSQYIDWLSGTAHLDRGLDSESLAPPSFSMEEAANKFDAKTETKYWGVTTAAASKGQTTNSLAGNAQRDDVLQIAENSFLGFNVAASAQQATGAA